MLPQCRITIRCTRSRGPRGFFCLQDFRRGPVNVDVIPLSMPKTTTARTSSFISQGARMLLFALGAIASVVVLKVLFDAECHSRFAYGFFSPYFSSILLVIYVWQFAILQTRLSWQSKQLCFAMVLAVSLPFIHWRCFPLPTIEAGTLTHFVSNPAWVLPVPVATFYKLRRTSFRDLSEKQFAILVCLISFAVLVWSVAWLCMLVITGFAPSWVNYFTNC